MSDNHILVDLERVDGSIDLCFALLTDKNVNEVHPKFRDMVKKIIQISKVPEYEEADNEWRN